MPISYQTTDQLLLKDKMERTNLQKSAFHSNDYTNAISGVEKSLKIENVPMKCERFCEFVNSL
jgi:DNA-binding transcriptional regulator WhiA